MTPKLVLSFPWIFCKARANYLMIDFSMYCSCMKQVPAIGMRWRSRGNPHGEFGSFPMLYFNLFWCPLHHLQGGPLAVRNGIITPMSKWPYIGVTRVITPIVYSYFTLRSNWVFGPTLYPPSSPGSSVKCCSWWMWHPWHLPTLELSLTTMVQVQIRQMGWLKDLGFFVDLCLGGALKYLFFWGYDPIINSSLTFFKWSMVPLLFFVAFSVIYVQSELRTLGVIVMFPLSSPINVDKTWLKTLTSRGRWFFAGLFCWQFDFSDAGEPVFRRLVNIYKLCMIIWCAYLIIFEYFIILYSICLNINVNIDVFKNSVIFHPM